MAFSDDINKFNIKYGNKYPLLNNGVDKGLLKMSNPQPENYSTDYKNCYYNPKFDKLLRGPADREQCIWAIGGGGASGGTGPVAPPSGGGPSLDSGITNDFPAWLCSEQNRSSKDVFKDVEYDFLTSNGSKSYKMRIHYTLSYSNQSNRLMIEVKHQVYSPSLGWNNKINAQDINSELSMYVKNAKACLKPTCSKSYTVYEPLIYPMSYDKNLIFFDLYKNFFRGLHYYIASYSLMYKLSNNHSWSESPVLTLESWKDKNYCAPL